MPKYSKWLRISVWHKNAESILHIRDQILKEGDPNTVKFVARRMKYAIFTRYDVAKMRVAMKAEEQKKADELQKLKDKYI